MILRDDEPLCHGCVYDKEGEYYRKGCGEFVAYKGYTTREDLEKMLKNAN